MYHAIGWKVNWKMANPRLLTTPNIGNKGNSGALKPFNPGSLRLIRIIERFTSTKESKKSKLAAEPTTSIGSVTAMATRMMPVTTTAMWGVRRMGWMTANRGGNMRSRPMLKATRDEASTVAFSADIVESRPPKTMMSTPTLGMKFSAARTMPVSL